MATKEEALATTTSVTRTIQAPAKTVFGTIAHIENFKQAVPAIVNVEFTSESRSGVGTKFKGMIRKEIEKDLDAVKSYCEGLAKSDEGGAPGS